MIPHICLVKHDPPNSYGDCVRACVASLLSIDRVEDVPHFFHDNCASEVAFDRVAEWLKTLNLAPFYTCYNGQASFENVLQATQTINPNVYQIICGANHAVIIRGGKVVHDPAWYKTKLDPPIDQNVWVLMTVVPLSVTLCNK